MKSLRVGLGLITCQVPPAMATDAGPTYRDAVQLAADAEQAGLDSVWVSEHHFAGDAYNPSLLVLLAAMAAKTSRIVLGTGTLLAALHDPVRLAEDVAVVDLISNGRLLLGLGLGWWDEEFRVFGVPRGERVARTIDAIEIVRRASRGRRFSYAGLRTSLTDARILPTPSKPVRIWVGGAAQPALLRVGAIADGFIASRCAPADFASRLASVDEGAARASREVPLPAAMVVDLWPEKPDGSEIQAIYAANDIYAAWRGGADVAGSELALPDRRGHPIPDLLVWGGTDRVVSRLLEYVDASGARDLTLVLRVTYPGITGARSREALAWVAESVAPALRSAVRGSKEAVTYGGSGDG